ncbi:hypothetical protein ASPNIDRAFT_140582, partial [Aspergillus niger ATCC 1015]
NLLEKFRQLLENYNNLKSDYEEEKEAREKYKRMARGQERNPFVLVLVDGDGYLFKEHLLKAGADGGITAARILNDSIRELLHDRLGHQADQCRVMSLARSGIVGQEARSLSPFTASFTRAEDLFDFVDAGDKKEGADYKIREMFRLFADNSQCKHIFFAGCHDSAANFHSEYERLGLPVRELPALFMSTPIGGTGSPSNHTPSLSTSSRPICKHFQKVCVWKSMCHRLHVN